MSKVSPPSVSFSVQFVRLPPGERAGTDENRGKYRAFVRSGGGFALIPLRSDSGRLSFGFSALRRDSARGSGAVGAGRGAGLAGGRGCLAGGFSTGRLSADARGCRCAVLLCVLLAAVGLSCRSWARIMGAGPMGSAGRRGSAGMRTGTGSGKAGGGGCRRIAARFIPLRGCPVRSAPALLLRGFLRTASGLSRSCRGSVAPQNH